MTTDARLYEMNPTGRFSDRVDDYVRYRPTYPAAAIDAILDGLRTTVTPTLRSEVSAQPHLTAADVGAGTGISTILLAQRGIRVIAVEPNADMRAAGPLHPLITWHDGTAESTRLPSASVDLVLCAQAFHWFRPPEALAEFHRILRPAGRLALVWNVRDLSDYFTTEYTAAVRLASGENRAETMPFDPAVVENSGVFGPISLREFPHSQSLDGRGIIGRAVSASYVPKSGPAYDRLVEMLAHAYERHADAGGLVHVRYVTRVFTSTAITRPRR